MAKRSLLSRCSSYVRWEPSCSMLTDGRTDRQTDMTKLTVASRNFANAPKSSLQRQPDKINVNTDLKGASFRQKTPAPTHDTAIPSLPIPFFSSVTILSHFSPPNAHSPFQTPKSASFKQRTDYMIPDLHHNLLNAHDLPQLVSRQTHQLVLIRNPTKSSLQ